MLYAILDSIVKSCLGTHIGHIPVAAPTCADDIAVMANTISEAQGILDIINYHTKRDLVKINPDKSDAIFYNNKETKDVTLKLGQDVIKKAKETKHLGILRNENNKPNIAERIRLGRATIYSLLGAGLHIRRGFSPVIAHKLWRTYAIPRCLYGLELLNINKKDMNAMEMAQRKILRQFQGLPNNTANVATYVLLGAEPTDITIDKNALTFFMNIVRNKNSIEYEIISRQNVMANHQDKGFVNRIDDMLYKYGLQTISFYLDHPVTKKKWKETIETATNKYWKRICQIEKDDKSSMKYIEIQNKPLKQAHNIWKSISNNVQDVRSGEIKVRVSTQTYLLQEKRAKFDPSVPSTCKLCRQADEDIEHFLLWCPAYQSIREKHLKKLRNYINSIEQNKYENIVGDRNLVQLLLDCTSKNLNCKQVCHSKIERLSRNYIYELHKERCKQMDC